MNVFDSNEYAVEARLRELRELAAVQRLARQAATPRQPGTLRRLRHRAGNLLIGAGTLLVGQAETLSPVPCGCE